MTEERLIGILRENGYSEISTDGELMKAMKQAVNEAIQECADTVDKYGEYLNQNGGTNVLLNLKMK